MFYYIIRPKSIESVYKIYLNIINLCKWAHLSKCTRPAEACIETRYSKTLLFLYFFEKGSSQSNWGNQQYETESRLCLSDSQKSNSSKPWPGEENCKAKYPSAGDKTPNISTPVFDANILPPVDLILFPCTLFGVKN